MLLGHQTVLTSAAMIMSILPNLATSSLSCLTMSRARYWGIVLQWPMPHLNKHSMACVKITEILNDFTVLVNLITIYLSLKGYDQYLKLKIDPKKLVMGVPWYGYDYLCLNLSQVTHSLKYL